MNQQEMIASIIGKRIDSATYAESVSDDEKLILVFTDGTELTVRGVACNDGLGALSFDLEK